MYTLDVYEEGAPKPRYRIRVAQDFALARVMAEQDITTGWLVVGSEDGGTVAVDLRRATRLVVRARTEHDERAYEEQQARAVA